MSIKALHIFLISCAVLLSLLFAVWAFIHSNNTGDKAYFNVSVLSAAVGIGLGFYGVYFMKKAKSL